MISRQLIRHLPQFTPLAVAEGENIARLYIICLDLSLLLSASGIVVRSRRPYA